MFEALEFFEVLYRRFRDYGQLGELHKVVYIFFILQIETMHISTIKRRLYKPNFSETSQNNQTLDL